jgi:hypothetical protein
MKYIKKYNKIYEYESLEGEEAKAYILDLFSEAISNRIRVFFYKRGYSNNFVFHWGRLSWIFSKGKAGISSKNKYRAI